VLLTACGQLSVPKLPDLPGRDTFAGPAFHTARWRDDVELRGRRVAVVGTGCSAIQVVPAIQPEVAHLDVYQRSPGWTIPRGDFAYSDRAKRLFERHPALQRLDRYANFAFHELGAAAMTRHRWLLPPFRAAGRRQITKAISDPVLRAKVTPRDEIGCKRIMLTDEWYPTLTKPNVGLVTDRIAEVTATGIRTQDGVERPADVLVLATGFETHGFVAPMEITGEDGRSLADEWADVPRAYLGVTVPRFPNMFLLYGPNTNGGTGSVIFVIESAMNHVLAALEELDRADAQRIEVSRRAAEAFDRELRAALAGTVWHSGCTNWYVDENGNDPNQWPWTWTAYRRRTERIEPGAYELAPAPRL
jgi:cation diffusion facilitator CzcD-associated flavoprotein CzcO